MAFFGALRANRSTFCSFTVNVLKIKWVWNSCDYHCYRFVEIWPEKSLSFFENVKKKPGYTGPTRCSSYLLFCRNHAWGWRVLLDFCVVVWVDANLFAPQMESIVTMLHRLQLVVGGKLRITPQTTIDDMWQPFLLWNLSVKGSYYCLIIWLLCTYHCSK